MKKLFVLVLIVAFIFAFCKMKDISAPLSAPSKVSTTLGYPCPDANSVPDETGIRWVQAALNHCIEQEGLEADPLAVDGHFGPCSQRATAAFQKAAGLVDDGCLNTDTVQAMIAVLDDGKTGIRNSAAENTGSKWTLETGTDSLRITKNDGPDGPELTIDCSTAQTRNSRTATVTVTDAEGISHQLNLTRTTPDD